MRRIPLIIMLCLCLCFGFISCGGGKSGPETGTGTDTEAGATDAEAGITDAEAGVTDAEAGTTDAETGAADSDSKADKTQESGSQKSLDYRLADKDEGIQLILSNKEYFDGFNQNDLDFRLQKKNAGREELEPFLKEQVLNFTDEEKDWINMCMEAIEYFINEKGYHLPQVDQIVLICTTMKEEGGAAAYTHGTQIYINKSTLDRYIDGGYAIPNLEVLLAHEIYHCLTRCNPEFRKETYKLIHFNVQDQDYEIPPSVMEYYITNPDVEHHNACAAFDIDGKATDCFIAYVTREHFKEKGDRFFDTGTPVLVPVDGTDRCYLPEESSDYDEVFGKNTDYVIDPEECMADNFAYLLVYEDAGPEGKGYPNPEIIEGIRKILLKN